MCPRTPIHVSSQYYMWPHTAIYAEWIEYHLLSGCYKCVPILLYVASYYYTCIRILLYMCPHTSVYPHTKGYMSKGGGKRSTRTYMYKYEDVYVQV
jgi:hypothetical protein